MARPVRIATLSIIIVIAALLAAIGWIGLQSDRERITRPDPSASERPDRPGQKVKAVAYAPNSKCVECHAAQAKAWAASQHAKAMAVASPQTVLGDFNGAEFRHAGVSSRFFVRDDRYYVRTPGLDGKPADFEIKYTFGLEPLQQYLIELPGGRLQAYTVAWDTVRKRWFHLYPDDKVKPGDGLHWTGRLQNWNMMCAACHTTDLKRRYDVQSDSYRTSHAEINVSCQSCHGPGADHVAWASSKPRASKPMSAAAMGLVVDTREHTAIAQVDLCAACHSRRSELAESPVPGSPLYDDYQPALLTQGLYHVDGQQLDEVYIYGSYRQSKMYQAGVRCTHCHDPHTSKPKQPDNAVCVQCHDSAPGGDQRFPQAGKKRYDAPSHHFHEPGTPGASCVECHMPKQTYMRVDPRRDHSVRVPRPDLSIKIGVPNACNQCHTDRPPQWAQDAVQRWYGQREARQAHYGEVFAAARARTPGSDAALEKLVLDSSLPAIVRATALDALRQFLPRTSEATLAGLRDSDPAVRLAAVSVVERHHPDERLKLISPLLRDPQRAVRIEAARAVLDVPASAFSPSQRQAFDASLAEYIAAQSASLDVPGSHLNLAVVDETHGRFDAAERRYVKAIDLDPDFAPARLNLARLYNTAGRNADAERILRAGVSRTPEDGELHYSLGLLLAEEKRLREAVVFLSEAAKRLSDRARVQYNYGLALQLLGRFDEAGISLRRAYALDPADAGIVYGLASFSIRQRDWNRAAELTAELRRINPGHPQLGQLVGALERQHERKQPPSARQ